MTTSRKVLLLLRQPPYASARPLEAVDVALVSAAFELPVAVLFEGPGIWQLLNDQDGQALDTRTQSKVLGALPHYEVTELYVCADSLAAAGLTTADLVLPVQVLTRAQQRELIAGCAAVVND